MGKVLPTYSELRDQILANAIFLFPPVNLDEGTRRFQVVMEYSAAHVVYREESGYRILCRGTPRYGGADYEMLDALNFETRKAVKARLVEMENEDANTMQVEQGGSSRTDDAAPKEPPPSYSHA